MLFIFAAVAVTNTANAQVKVGININIGDQPQWGPSGYDYAEYYYLPDIETYYYVPRRQFVYQSNGRWIFSSSLPPAYANYNLYSGYKVVLKDHDAYNYFNDHRERYAHFRNYDNRQLIIRDKHDNGNHYGQYKNKDKEERGRGNGKGNGKDKNRD